MIEASRPMRLSVKITIALALAFAVTACGGGSAALTSSSSRTLSATGASSSTPAPSAAVPTPASGCSANLAAEAPGGVAVAGPSLGTLVRRLGAHRPSSVAFTQRTCVGTGASAVSTTLSAVVRLKPSLLAGATEMVGGRTVRVRLIGGTEYVELPQLGARDGGRPWLAVSLARTGAAIGINLKQLLSESANLDPSHNLRLLASASQFRSIGRTVLDGMPVYGFLGTFDIAHLPRSVFSAGLAAQLRAKLLALGASSELVATYVTARGETVRVVTALPSTSRGAIETVQDIGAINPTVRVTPPPAAQTISYGKAQALLGAG